MVTTSNDQQKEEKPWKRSLLFELIVEEMVNPRSERSSIRRSTIKVRVVFAMSESSKQSIPLRYHNNGCESNSPRVVLIAIPDFMQLNPFSIQLLLDDELIRSVVMRIVGIDSSVVNTIILLGLQSTFRHRLDDIS